MNVTLFAAPQTLLSGLLVGFCFGFLLRKALVTRFDVIVNQLLLIDFTVMKVILSAIAFGSIGIYAFITFFPQYSLLVDSSTFLSTAIGGGLFGIGMATMGYCPGTGIGALAAGARDMIFGILGMIFGAIIYAQFYPHIVQHVKSPDALNKLTLPELFNVSPWIVIIGVWGMLICLAYFDNHFINSKK